MRCGNHMTGRMCIVKDVWHRLTVTLLLVLVFITNGSVGSDEAATATCTLDEKDGSAVCSTATDKDQPQQLCFPDGNCFNTLEKAKAKYQDSINFVSLDEPVPFGDKQQVSGEQWQATMDVIVKTQQYMAGVFKNETTKAYRDGCKCRHELCAFWSAIGECEVNPDYMLLQCAPVCQTCHQLSFDHRCPYDKNAPVIWAPGDLNKMFERLTSEEYYVQRYEPNILSQPPDGPWIITLENVASQEECARMIELGAIKGYERSEDVGEMKFDGTFDSKRQDTRTSTNAWCEGDCHNDTLNQNVLRTVENITGIPDSHSEYWQFLKYEVGQFYGEHHDFIEFHNQRYQGPRILTVFLYLNDVPAGGGTHFTDMGITVQPKRGRVVIWPSVLDSDIAKQDLRTHHEALPVKEGIKYGANAWIHTRDFKKAYHSGCS